MPFVNVYQFVYASFPFGFESSVWDLIILVPDRGLFFILICGTVADKSENAYKL